MQGNGLKCEYLFFEGLSLTNYDTRSNFETTEIDI